MSKALRPQQPSYYPVHVYIAATDMSDGSHGIAVGTWTISLIPPPTSPGEGTATQSL